MTSDSIEDTRPDTADAGRRGGDGWVTVQRFVAGALIATFVYIMAFVAQAFVGPLAAFAAVFAIPLALTWWRRRGPAIAIGVLAAIWLLLQIVNASQVLPDLTDPAATGSFIGTFPQVVVPIAGIVGLVGLVRRASATTATRTLQVTGAVLVLAAGVSIVAGVLAGDDPAAVSDGPATVTLQDIEFQPAGLQVPTGAEVTWEWADGQIQHDVVAADFASELKSDGTFTHTFDTPGTYAYECSIHPAMTGTVTVVARDADDPDGGG